MTAFTNLLDGGLSIKIAGVERNANVHGLEWESTVQGDGAASFWMPVTDPFAVNYYYPELKTGASVVVTHTLNGVTTNLYYGYVLSDPRVAYAGEKAIVNVECGGALEFYTCRTDMGAVWQDADLAQWKEHPQSASPYVTGTSGAIRIHVDKGAKPPSVSAGVAGVIGYLLYDGYGYLQGLPAPMPNGIVRISGRYAVDLADHMEAALCYSLMPANSQQAANGFVSDCQRSHYAIADSSVHWTTNASGSFNVEFSSPVRYIALLMWCNGSGVKTTGERYAVIEDLMISTAATNQRVDQAMLAVAQFGGLLPNGYSTAVVGNTLTELLVRPATDLGTMLSDLAAQAPVLVEWGFWAGKFRCLPMATDQAQIRGWQNCYLVDATVAGNVWDVHQHPENGQATAVRLLYGSRGSALFADGTQCALIAPADTGYFAGHPFLGATAQVLTVDFSANNMTAAQAQTMANKLASFLGLATSSGTWTVQNPTVPVYGGGTRPAPYIHAGDFAEALQAVGQHSTGPLYITRAHVVADTGAVDMDVGLAADLLVEQLAAIGSVSPVVARKASHSRRAHVIVPRKK